MNYTWDPKKNRQNIARHGIAFEDAVKIFEGRTLERVDDHFEYGETRVYAVGITNGVEITVIYVDLSDSQRRLGRRRDMKERRIGTRSMKARSDWDRVRSLNDDQLRRAIETDADVYPTDSDFWKAARVVMPKAKQTVTIRLDTDLLEWFRRQKGYQTQINAVLRTYMEAHLPGRQRQ